MPISVVLDTNFLTIPAQFGVDVFSETERLLERNVEFILLDSIVEEIKSKIGRANGTDYRPFKVALDLSERCTIVRVEPQLKDFKVDDQLLEYTASVNGVLATNDRELRKRATKRGLPVLMLRGKKHLKLKGTIL